MDEEHSQAQCDRRHRRYGPCSDIARRLFGTLAQGCSAAILMSGLGSNARSLLHQRGRYPGISISAIVTNKPMSGAAPIAEEFGLKYIERPEKDRDQLFRALSYQLDIEKIDVLLYAGFMLIAPAWFVDRHVGVNVHPGDLSIRDTQGRPRYVGLNAVANALGDGADYLASTFHVIEPDVDCGWPIAVSRHFQVPSELRDKPHDIHLRLKPLEHELYPSVLAAMSRGLVESDMEILHEEDGQLSALLKLQSIKGGIT